MSETTVSKRFVEKQVDGDNNGGKRLVAVKRLPKSYPTQENSWKLRPRQRPYVSHKHKLRSTITPGTVMILVAGRHKGKKVVFLKQLQSGLMLVTGPYHVNGCPLRRVNQIYAIATKTKLDISKVDIPERLTDSYFKRKSLKKPKHAEGEIFDSKKEEYQVSAERKEDQIALDTQLLKVIRSHPEKKCLLGYLSTLFSIKKGEYPHNMIF